MEYGAIGWIQQQESVALGRHEKGLAAGGGHGDQPVAHIPPPLFCPVVLAQCHQVFGLDLKCIAPRVRGVQRCKSIGRQGRFSAFGQLDDCRRLGRRR